MWLEPKATWHFRSAPRLLCIGVALLGAACTGELLSGGASDAGAGPPGAACLAGNCAGSGGLTAGGAAGSGATAAPGGPGEAAMRRLNNAEYQNTLRDLFGSAGTEVGFPEEGRTEGYDTLSSALAVSPLHVVAYLEAASDVVGELFDADPAGLKASFCGYQTADAGANLSCAQLIVSDFAARAWRRPLAAWRDEGPVADELALLQPSGPLGMLPLEARLRTALEAVLVSPRFIFRVELADASGSLDNASLASRLSYFLWSSAPDSELLASDLGQRATVDAQLGRLQQSPRFERFLERFPQLWLELEKLEKVERDSTVYPAYSPQVVKAMGEETRSFFASYWKDPKASISGILLAPRPATTDPELAKIYGDSPRLGLATQASIMTLTGASNRTSPVRRGMWVLERLLCAPPPPPPANVNTGDVSADPSLSERDRLAMHRANPTCAGCHNLMDPIGLGFENYDAIGVYRTVDKAGNAIDASGVLPGSQAPFQTASELIGLLARDTRLQGCVVKQLLTYATGRTYDGDDEALIDLVRQAAGGAEASFQSVLNGVVQSDAFRRRAEEK